MIFQKQESEEKKEARQRADWMSVQMWGWEAIAEAHQQAD